MPKSHSIRLTDLNATVSLPFKIHVKGLMHLHLWNCKMIWLKFTYRQPLVELQDDIMVIIYL